MRRSSVQTQDVLAALLAEPSHQRYGLDLAKEAGLPSGTIYPILARLESRGWIESEWEDIDPVVEGRRPRRYYRLTGEGEAAARRELEETARRLSMALGRRVMRPGMAQ